MASASTRNAYAAPSRSIDDVEKGLAMSEFADAVVRRGFVRKVFGLLAAQLLLTVAISATMMSSAAVKAFVATSSIPVFFSIALTMGPLVYMTVSEKARSEHPTNLVLMGLFTLGEGTLVGMATSSFDTDIVLVAFGITAAVTVALTAFALTSKSDFTGNGPFLYVGLLTLLTASLVGFFVRTPIFNLGISVAGAVLFSMYMVYDVQILMGGHHKVRVSPDEYVFAAINIYLDIINLFLYILRILASNRDS